MQTVLDEIKRNVEKGEPFEAIQKSVREKLAGKLGPDGFHLETVYRNAVQASYNAGRWQQLTDPEMTLLRPYLLFDAVLDDRTTSVCRQLDGTVKSHDDPFWLTRCPALHHRCRSTLRSLRTSEARRRGITVGEPAVAVPDGWGAAPPLKANGYELKPKAERFAPEAWAEYQKRNAVAMDELDVAMQGVKEQRELRRRADPATWKHDYELELGEAGPAVAWGRAMEERGLQLTAQSALEEHAALVVAGADGSPFARQAVERVLRAHGVAKNDMASALAEHTLGALADLAVTHQRPLEEVHIRGLAALAGHATSITRAKSAQLDFFDVVSHGNGIVKQDELDELAARAQAFYLAIADASLKFPKKLVLESTADDRGEYSPAFSWMNAGDGTLGMLVHEVGHALDHATPALARRALAFRQARTVGEPTESLLALTGDKQFKPDEITKKDLFYKAYMGRVYGAPLADYTEVTSMAIQALVDQPIGRLMLLDRLTLYFALGQLAGGKLP